MIWRSTSGSRRDRPKPAPPHFSWARIAERGPVVNRLNPHADATTTKARDSSSTVQAPTLLVRRDGADPPRGGLYSLTETGLVMATQNKFHPAAYRRSPPASIPPSEAFRCNQPDVASHHWPFDQVHVPTVRTCGSSRTSQDYYRNNSISRSSVG